MGNVFEFVKGLVVVAALVWAGWYGYSKSNDAPSPVSETRQAAKFNCRKALADLAKGYECLNSDNCGETSTRQEKKKKLEADIGQFCN